MELVEMELLQLLELLDLEVELEEVVVAISIMDPALDGDSGVTLDSCVCCGTILINKMC